MENRMQSNYNIVPTIMPRTPSGRGMLGSMRDAVFGKRDAHAAAIKEMNQHGGGFRAFSRFISYAMLFAFSAQGVMAQVRPDALAVFASLQRGEWPDINQALTVFVVVVFVLGCDLTIIAMSEYIRHKLIQGVNLSDLTWQLLLVVIPGVIEACTYIKIIVETETPHNLFDWLLLGARAFFLPVVVVVLATLRAMPFTHKDYQQTQAVRLSLHAIDYTNHVLSQIDPRKIDGGALISALASVNEMTPEQAAQMQHHADSIAALLPDNAQAQQQSVIDAIQREAEAHIRDAEARAEDAIRRVEDRLREMERANKQQLYDMALHLSLHGTFPPDVIEQNPALASFTLPTRGRSGQKPPTPRTPKTRTEAWKAMLEDVDIQPVVTPDGKRGVWVKSGDVGRLVTGKLAPDRLRRIMHDCGGDLTFGTSLIAPIDAIMRELFALHIVSDSVEQAYHKYIASSVETDGEAPAIVSDTADDSAEDSDVKRVA
ncbi:MAG: hypothetical protein ACXWP0_03665 [Ktedonobacterales bacterium]